MLAECPRRALSSESVSTHIRSAGTDWIFSWPHHLSEFICGAECDRLASSFGRDSSEQFSEKLFLIPFDLSVYDLFNTKMLFTLVSFLFLLFASLPQFREKGLRSLESNPRVRIGAPECSRMSQNAPGPTRARQDALGHPCSRSSHNF